MTGRTSVMLIGYGLSTLIFFLAVACHWWADAVQRRINRWHNRLRSKYRRPNWAVRATSRNYVPNLHLTGVILFILFLVGIVLTAILSQREL